jgi:phage terminase large subunit-like protein
VYPNKENAKNKIDGIVALIMALGRATLGEIETESVYEKRGVLTF